MRCPWSISSGGLEPGSGGIWSATVGKGGGTYNMQPHGGWGILVDGSHEAVIGHSLIGMCEDAAVKTHTIESRGEGRGLNWISSPEAALCLDLPAWQKYFGFDKNGAYGDMDIHIDPRALTRQDGWALTARAKSRSRAETGSE